MVNNIKKHALSHMIVSIVAFAFSLIIMALIAANFNDAFVKITNTDVTTSVFVFSMFLFAIIVAILAIWTFLYNRLKQNEMIKKIMLSFLISFGIAALYIMAIMIVNVSIISISERDLSFADIKSKNGSGGWLAVNVIATALTLAGAILSVITYIKVKNTAQKVEKVKAKIEQRAAKQA